MESVISMNDTLFPNTVSSLDDVDPQLKKAVTQRHIDIPPHWVFKQTNKKKYVVLGILASNTVPLFVMCGF